MKEEGKDKQESIEREEIFSKAVRAGKRTYFFDVKSTRKDDYYLTITESKKRFNKDGRFYYEKHKIFLYKEDFEKFMDGLTQSVEFIQKEKPYVPEDHTPQHHSNEAMVSEKEEVATVADEYTSVEFEDLGNKD